MDQVQELLSNPSELQGILKKLFGANDMPKVLPPEELQNQSQLTSPSAFHSATNMPYPSPTIYSPPSRLNAVAAPGPIRGPGPALNTGTQPYNSSLAFMQGNRRNLPPLQPPDRCFSSSNQKTTAKPSQTISRSYSTSTTHPSNPIVISTPLSAPPLMKVNPSYSSNSTSAVPVEPITTRWSAPHDSQYYVRVLCDHERTVNDLHHLHV